MRNAVMVAASIAMLSFVASTHVFADDFKEGVEGMKRERTEGVGAGNKNTREALKEVERESNHPEPSPTPEAKGKEKDKK